VAWKTRPARASADEKHAITASAAIGEVRSRITRNCGLRNCRRGIASHIGQPRPAAPRSHRMSWQQ
jgi:hypothetical protein